MRLWTKLDLRNIKDIYTRAAFRRLNDFMAELSGNLSPSNPTSSVIQIVKNNTVPSAAQEFIQIDDFYRQFVDTNDISVRTFDGFSWKRYTGGVPTFKDARTLSDTTYPDTGIWIATLGTITADYVVIVSGDITADAVSFFGRFRPGTKIFVGLGIPAGNAMNAHAGIEYDGIGNTYDPQACCRLFYFEDGQDYDFPIGPGVTYHGIANKKSFVALQINTLAGGKDLYGIGSTTAYALASATKIPKVTFEFQAGTTHGNRVTCTVEGVGTVTVDDVDPTGWMQLGARVRGAAPAGTSQKAFFDYVGLAKPQP